MIEDSKLKDALLALAEGYKAHTTMLSALANEIAALRETWKEMNGEEFSNYLQQMQLKVMADNATTETLNLRLCDELIAGVKVL